MTKKRSPFSVDILTLFPDVVSAYTGASILGRAQAKGVAVIRAHQIRDFATDKHHTTDDPPYGGGAGMVMKAEPILRGIDAATRLTRVPPKRRRIILLSAKGTPFTQRRAATLAKQYDHLIMVCGRYEGIDERVQRITKAEELSIGPYVLTDGDVGAMVIASAVVRLLPGAIRWESLAEESHWRQTLHDEVATGKNDLLEYPHYTRPETLSWKRKKYSVPKILLGGNHADIARWRKEKRQPAA